MYQLNNLIWVSTNQQGQLTPARPFLQEAKLAFVQEGIKGELIFAYLVVSEKKATFKKEQVLENSWLLQTGETQDGYTAHVLNPFHKNPKSKAHKIFEKALQQNNSITLKQVVALEKLQKELALQNEQNL